MISDWRRTCHIPWVKWAAMAAKHFGSIFELGGITKTLTGNMMTVSFVSPQGTLNNKDNTYNNIL